MHLTTQTSQHAPLIAKEEQTTPRDPRDGTNSGLPKKQKEESR